MEIKVKMEIKALQKEIKDLGIQLEQAVQSITEPILLDEPTLGMNLIIPYALRSFCYMNSTVRLEGKRILPKGSSGVERLSSDYKRQVNSTIFFQTSTKCENYKEYARLMKNKFSSIVFTGREGQRNFQKLVLRNSYFLINSGLEILRESRLYGIPLTQKEELEVEKYLFISHLNSLRWQSAALQIPASPNSLTSFSKTVNTAYLEKKGLSIKPFFFVESRTTRNIICSAPPLNVCTPPFISYAELREYFELQERKY